MLKVFSWDEFLGIQQAEDIAFATSMSLSNLWLIPISDIINSQNFVVQSFRRKKANFLFIESAIESCMKNIFY